MAMHSVMLFAERGIPCACPTSGGQPPHCLPCRKPGRYRPQAAKEWALGAAMPAMTAPPQCDPTRRAHTGCCRAAAGGALPVYYACAAGVRRLQCMRAAIAL